MNRYMMEMIAKKYDEFPDQFTEISKDDLDNFRKLVNKMFADISKIIFFDFVDYEPYGENPKISDMLKDFRKGVIKIHTTGNQSRIWGTFYNLQFRAVHDFVHCVHQLEFNHENENKVLGKQVELSYQYGKVFPQLDWTIYKAVLRSEIVYQSAYKEVYGKFHIDQKIILVDL